MKAIYLLVCLVLSSLAVMAQPKPFTPENVMPPSSASNLFNITPPEAKYMGQNILGKIYALPLDNMPCIVPAIGGDHSMPVYVTPLTGTTMPNAIPKQRFFRLPFSHFNLLKLNKAPKEASKNLMLDLIRKK